MRIFFDFEFIENADQHPVHPISLGMVREDGVEYYAEFADIPWHLANNWVLENIKPTIGSIPVLTKKQIAQDVTQFVGYYPEFWGWYCDYDWVLMTSMFGFLNVPDTWPHLALDLRQYMYHLDLHREDLDHIKNEKEHHALADAQWNMKVYDYLEEVRRDRD